MPRGSIPAWAGQPSDSAMRVSALTVYPRVGGATYSPRLPLALRWGLSPRGRGNQDPGAPDIPHPTRCGLSPRGRGNHGEPAN